MNDHSIVGQLKAEILNLEEAVQQLDERKKLLKVEIRTRKRALKLLDDSRGGHDERDLESDLDVDSGPATLSRTFH